MPTAMRKLRGERIKPTTEPIPSPRPVCRPAWLEGDAGDVWDHYAPPLIAAGILTAWDTERFANWCDAVALRRLAVTQLEQGGRIIDTPVYDRNGKRTGTRPQRSPWLLVWKDADRMVGSIGARFGLTPRERRNA